MRPGISSTQTCGANQFQYRKRYEVTCDVDAGFYGTITFEFQYRKRYEVTCDEKYEDR